MKNEQVGVMGQYQLASLIKTIVIGLARILFAEALKKNKIVCHVDIWYSNDVFEN